MEFNWLLTWWTCKLNMKTRLTFFTNDFIESFQHSPRSFVAIKCHEICLTKHNKFNRLLLIMSRVVTKAKVKFVKLIFAPPMELISMAIYSQSMIVQSFYDFLYWNNGGVNSFKKHSNDTFCGNFMVNTKSFSFLQIPKFISGLNVKLAKCLLIVFDTNLVGLQIG